MTAQKPFQTADKKITLNQIIYLLDNKTKTAGIVGTDSIFGDILIPSSVLYEDQEYFVTSILGRSFTKLNHIQSIQFSDDSKLQTIKTEAFYMSSINSITLPSSTIELEENWFYNTKISKIHILPGNNRYISYDDQIILEKSNPGKENYDILSFSVHNLTSVKIPNFVEIIGQKAFENCESLSKIEIPDDSKLRTIENSAFAYTSIESLTIPSSCVELKEGWCIGTNKLKEIKISTNNPKYICYNNEMILSKSQQEKNNYNTIVFCNRNISKIIIPNFIEIIDSYAFCGCEELTQVEIPNDSKLQHICKYSFSGTKIKEITLPPHLTHICEGAFYECHHLTKVEINSNSKLQFIGKSAFYSTSINSILIPQNVIQINEDTFGLCANLKSIKFSEDSKLQIIEKNAFLGTSVESLIIPSSCVELKEGWLNGTNNLKEIKVSTNNPKYICYNNEMILGKSQQEKNNYDTIVFCNRNIRTATIPNFIEIIDSYAFMKCKKLYEVNFQDDSKLRIIGNYAFSESFLMNIKFPPHLTKIGEFAFADCRLLKKVEFSENSELQIIDKFAFHLSFIERIEFPSSLKEIREDSFSLCNKLFEIKIPINSKLQKIGVKAFARTKIKDITIGSQLKIIDDSAFENCANLHSFNIPLNSELQTIGSKAFSHTLIESLTIPSSCVELKEGWCIGTNKLKEIKISTNNPKYICYNNEMILSKSQQEKNNYDTIVFCNRNISKIIIPNFIEIIDSYAFCGCEELTQVEIPNDSKLQHICKYSFSGTNIKEIILPPYLTHICEGAFSFCKQIQKVEIPSDSRIQCIQEFAFANSSIEYFSFPPKLTKISDRTFEYCNKLRYVEITADSNLQIIGISAFEKSSIEGISLPSNLIIISKFAFSGCNNLINIEIPNESKLKIIEEGAFSQGGIENFIVPRNLLKITENTFYRSKLSKIEIPDDSKLKTIENSAFAYTSIESLTIPSSCVELKEGWCIGTNKLKEIKISTNNPKYICYNNEMILSKSQQGKNNYDTIVFCNRNISKIIIPNFIEIIDSYAFCGCQRLQSIDFQSDSKLNIIGKLAFASSSINKIIIPPHLTRIDESAFSDCTQLSKVIIPENSELQTINDYAFETSQIKSFYIPSHLTNIKQYAFKSSYIQIIEISDNRDLPYIYDNIFRHQSLVIIMIPKNVKLIHCESFKIDI